VTSGFLFFFKEVLNSSQPLFLEGSDRQHVEVGRGLECFHNLLRADAIEYDFSGDTHLLVDIHGSPQSFNVSIEIIRNHNLYS
jgi:hypothetical protein